MPLFRAAEMMDIAVEKEKRRRDFYHAAAEQFTDQRLRNLFSHLEKWEETHVAKLQQLREHVEDSSVHESYPGEYRAYVDTLIDQRIYEKTSLEQFQHDTRTPREAIERAIGFEKDSILFFQELARFVSSEGEKTVRQLIEEEKHHIVELVSRRADYEA